MKFVLLGMFQADSLEARFGQYRQPSGKKYNISLRQDFDSVKKLSLLATLKLKLKEKDKLWQILILTGLSLYQTLKLSSWCRYAMTIIWKLRSTVFTHNNLCCWVRLLCYHGRNLVGEAGDVYPQLFQTWGT